MAYHHFVNELKTKSEWSQEEGDGWILENCDDLYPTLKFQFSQSFVQENSEAKKSTITQKKILHSNSKINAENPT